MTPTRIEPVYRIGTVSRLTGIATVTLRMWERRYGVVEPQRNGGQSRLYSRDDIGRLTLIKRLVDGGHPISTVANLSLEQLTERAALNDFGTDARGVTLQIAAFGAALPILVQQAFTLAPALDAHLIASETDQERFVTAIEQHSPSVIAMEWPTLHEEHVHLAENWLQRSRAERAVVVYGFARRSVVQRLQRGPITALRAPVDSQVLRRALLGEGMLVRESMVFHLPETAEQPAPPRFSLTTLSHLASVVTAVECECPRHLAELVSSLQSFEQYSAECVHRSPADQALHEFLQLVTARARSLMETALEQVANAEGIELPPPETQSAAPRIPPEVTPFQPRNAARNA